MNKVVAGTMSRGSASSVGGPASSLTFATAILAFVWRVVRENRTSVSDFHYEFDKGNTFVKHRYCMEPPLLSSVPPCTLLNDKFFYRKTYCCLEPPPSVAVLKLTAFLRRAENSGLRMSVVVSSNKCV